MTLFAENVLGEFCFMIFAAVFIIGMVGMYQGIAAMCRYFRGEVK